MKKDFGEFQIKLTSELFKEIVGDEMHSFDMTPKMIDGKLQIDANQIAVHILSTSVILSKEILRQYHEWLNTD